MPQTDHETKLVWTRMYAHPRKSEGFGQLRGQEEEH